MPEDKPITYGWLIWSIEHKAWWKGDCCGYVKKRGDAGVFTFEAARRIVLGADINERDIPNEAMVPVVITK